MTGCAAPPFTRTATAAMSESSPVTVKTACAGSARSLATSVRSPSSAVVSGATVTLSRFGPFATVLASRMVFWPAASVTVTLSVCQLPQPPAPVPANSGFAAATPFTVSAIGHGPLPPPPPLE